MNNSSEKTETTVEERQLTGRLLTYRDNYEAGLRHADDYAKLFRTLITTTEYDALLSSARDLFSFKIDSDFVVFPKKFEPSDYYLVFMTRLIELQNMPTKLSLLIQESNGHEQLRHTWKGSDQEFRFHADSDQAKYVEEQTNRQLFVLNLKKRTMSFDTDTINDLYFLNRNEEQSEAFKDQIALFSQFGSILENVYDFKVDFNMFDARNSKTYLFKQSGLNKNILDQLFVASSKRGLVFMNDDQVEGGYLELKNATFKIVEVDPSTHQWAFKVTDDGEKQSLFEILNSYDFIREWYIKNIDELKLKMVI